MWPHAPEYHPPLLLSPSKHPPEVCLLCTVDSCRSQLMEKVLSCFEDQEHLISHCIATYMLEINGSKWSILHDKHSQSNEKQYVVEQRYPGSLLVVMIHNMSCLLRPLRCLISLLYCFFTPFLCNKVLLSFVTRYWVLPGSRNDIAMQKH